MQQRCMGRFTKADFKRLGIPRSRVLIKDKVQKGLNPFLYEIVRPTVYIIQESES